MRKLVVGLTFQAESRVEIKVIDFTGGQVCIHATGGRMIMGGS